MPESTSDDGRVEQLRERWDRDRSSRLFLQVAEEYRRVGRLREAIEVLEDGLKIQPGYYSAWVALGRCLLEAGRPADACPALERVVAFDPTQLVANKLLIEACLQTGQPAKARERLDLYVLLNPGDAEIESFERRLLAQEPTPAPAEQRPVAPRAPLAAWPSEPPPASAPSFDFAAAEPFELPVRAAPPLRLELRSSAARREPRPVWSATLAEPFPALAASAAAERLRARAITAEGLFPLRLVAPAAAIAVESAPAVLPSVDELLEETAVPWRTQEVSPPALELADEVPVGAAELPAPSAEPAGEGAWLAPEEPADLPAGLVSSGVAATEVAEASEFDGAAAVEASPLAAAVAQPEFSAPLIVDEPARDERLPAAATLTLASLYLRQGHLAEAEAALRSVLEREPGHPEAEARLAEIERRRGEPVTAATLLSGSAAAGERGLTQRKILILRRYLERLARARSGHVS